MTNKKIREVLKIKGRAMLSVDPVETVAGAAKKMVENKVGSLLVMQGGRISGIITERDCLRQLAAGDRPAIQVPVAQLMTRDLVAVQADDTVAHAMSVMTRKRCRHLPVVEGDSLVGIVSIGDLVRQAAEDQQAEIHYLTEYILGNYPGVEARGSAVFPAAPSTSA